MIFNYFVKLFSLERLNDLPINEEGLWKLDISVLVDVILNKNLSLSNIFGYVH